MRARLSTILVLCLLYTLTACNALTPTIGGTITVVSDLPMSGITLAETQSIVSAINQTFESKNFKVCQGKWKIVYRAYDNASYTSGKLEKELVINNAKEFVNNTNIVAVIGGYNGEAASLSLPILNTEQLILISPTATLAELTQTTEPQKYYPNQIRNFVRLPPSDRQLATYATQWTQTLGAKNVFIVSDIELGSQSAAAEFEKTLKNLPIQFVGRGNLDPAAKDYLELATKIKTQAPELIFLSSHLPKQAAQFLKDLRGAGYKGQVMGTQGISNRAFITESGDTADGVITVIGGVTLDQVAPWRESYVAKFQGEPELTAIYGNVAAEILLAAFEQVCQKGKLPSDRTAVREAVYALKDLPSNLGKVTVELNGETTISVISGLLIKQGKFALWKP